MTPISRRTALTGMACLSAVASAAEAAEPPMTRVRAAAQALAAALADANDGGADLWCAHVLPAGMLDHPIILERRGWLTAEPAPAGYHQACVEFFQRCSPIERAWFHALQLADAMEVLRPGAGWCAKVRRDLDVVGAFSGKGVL